MKSGCKRKSSEDDGWIDIKGRKRTDLGMGKDKVKGTSRQY